MDQYPASNVALNCNHTVDPDIVIIIVHCSESVTVYRYTQALPQVEMPKITINTVA